MLKNLKLLSATFFILFILLEVALRLFFDIYPGEKYHSPYFTQVDSLVVYHGFDADSYGIMKIDSKAAEIISDRINTWHTSGKIVATNDTECKQVYDLVHYAIDFEKPEFACSLKSFISRKDFPANDLDSGIVYYLSHPVNADGFRSIPFRNYRSGKKKVLLLGDSFTWGFSAKNLYSSFADNLLAKGYAVYNTGITATDPVQYQQIAKKYVPVLKPDVVVMNVYLNNDIQYYYRKPIPYIPQLIPSNGGLLQTSFEGITLSTPDSVYAVISNNVKIPVENSWFHRLCSYTSTTTLIWRVLAKFHRVNEHSNKYNFIWDAAVKTRTVQPDVNERVRVVQKLCDENGAKLLVCVIPYMNQVGLLTGPSAFKFLFDSIPYHLSPVSKKGYQKGYDGHFNDEGHKEYAEFLDSLMRD